MFDSKTKLIATAFALSTTFITADANELSKVPPLDGTVLFAAGSFHAYSLMPVKGDKLKLDVNKILSSGNKPIFFDPVKKAPGPNPYIPIMSPFKIKAAPDYSKFKRGYRLVSQSSKNPDNKVIIDLHKPIPGKKKWPIYIVYESGGLVEGMTILEGVPISKPKSSKKSK